MTFATRYHVRKVSNDHILTYFHRLSHIKYLINSWINVFVPQRYNSLKTKSAALVCRFFSDGNGCSSTQWGERGDVQAHFKGCIATNPRVEGGICQKGQRRLLHRLSRLLNGALLFLKDLGTMLELPEDGFCTCWTQNQFGLCLDKSPVSLTAAQLSGNKVEQTESFKLLKSVWYIQQRRLQNKADMVHWNSHEVNVN